MKIRRRFREIVKDNVFWIAVILAAAFAVLLYHAAFRPRSSPRASAPVSKPKEKKNPIGRAEFKVSCFGGRLVLKCKSSKGGHCSADFQSIVRNVCKGLEQLDIEPFGNIDVSLKKFDKCDEELEREFGCLLNFLKGRAAGGRETGSIRLPAYIYSGNRETLKIFLIHEVSHALVSRYEMRTVRVVDEFFAVYTQVQFLGKKKFFTVCNGEKWNRPFLRTYGGDYVFPPKKSNKRMDLLSVCRYGQLEHIARLLQKKSPFLYGALWREFKKARDGEIGTARLKQWIKAADREAGAMASRFNIFLEAAPIFRLAVIEDDGEYCVFVHQAVNAWKERYGENISASIKWKRGDGVITRFRASGVPEYCWKSGLMPFGAIAHIKVTAGGKVFHEVLRLQ